MTREVKTYISTQKQRKDTSKRILFNKKQELADLILKFKQKEQEIIEEISYWENIIK